MVSRGERLITGAGGGVVITLRSDRPYYTPGDDVRCTLSLQTSQVLRFRKITAELACCEKLFSGRVRTTRVVVREQKAVSGPGKMLPPGGSLSFTMRIPPRASPTYMGYSILRVWRIKASVGLRLAPNLVADQTILVLRSFRRGGPMTSSASRGEVAMELSIRRGVFLPNETIEGFVALSGTPRVQSSRLELLAVEKLVMGRRGGEVVLPRRLRSLVLPVRSFTPFSLRAPGYSPFEDESSSVEYMLRAIARLKAGKELAVVLPILVGIPEVGGAEDEGSRAPDPLGLGDERAQTTNGWLSPYVGHGLEELLLGPEDARTVLGSGVGLQ